MATDGNGFLQPCPFCGKSFGLYELLAEHIERRHTEDSAFVVREGPGNIHSSPSTSPPQSPLLVSLPPPPPRRPAPVPKGEPAGSSSEDGVEGLAPPLPARPPPPRPSLTATPDQAVQDVSDWEESSSESEEEAREGVDEEFVACPLEECGEQVLSSDLTDHIELHQQEQLDLRDDTASHPQTPSSHYQNYHYRPYSSSATLSPQHASFSAPQRASADYSPAYGFYGPGPATAAGHPNQSTMPISTDFRGPASSSSTSLPLRQPSPGAYSSVAGDGSPTPRTQSRSSYHSNDRRSISENETRLPKDDSSDFSSADVPDALRNAELPGKTHRKHQAASWEGMRKKYLSISGIVSQIEGSKKLKRPRKSRKSKNSLRLGRKELGPHAYEDRMPRWLFDQLKQGPKIRTSTSTGRDGRKTTLEIVENESPGIVPMLARLSELDPSVGMAYFCHPSTKHICKTRKEGGFCGYRNIQMQVSYMQGAKADGHVMFPGRTPNILSLQHQIETAWDNGISEISRQQIGRLIGTRKWIGTLEANALYASLGIPCEVFAFADSNDGKFAHENLMDRVEAYFVQGRSTNYAGRPAPLDRINRTLLPPIYLQQPGHSLTIVGIERHTNGSRNLLVLDPMYLTSRAMNQLLDVGPRSVRRPRPEAMNIYRRGDARLGKHAEFEILILTTPPPVFPAWDVRSSRSYA